MNVLREIYDFITGGSIVAPIGLVVAIGAVILSKGMIPGDIADCIFVAIILLTLACATREKVA